MQIVRGGKLSRFSRISLQSRMFTSENFFLVMRCFLTLKCRTAGQGSGPGLLRYFKPWQHIDLLDYLTYKSLARSCPTILIDMETSNATIAFSNFSINTLREILCDSTYFYAREHRKLFVFTWRRIFSEPYAIAKVFPRITRRACNRESFPPRTICIIRYLSVKGLAKC